MRGGWESGEGRKSVNSQQNWRGDNQVNFSQINEA